MIRVLAWVVLALLLAVVGLGAALKIESIRLESCKAGSAAFVAQVEANGKVAIKRAKAKAEADRKSKEKHDAENKRLRADNAALARRLRDARASVHYLPAPAPTAKRPTVACLDRAEFESAIQRLDQEVSGIVEQGDQARIDLDTAKAWAAGL